MACVFHSFLLSDQKFGNFIFISNSLVASFLEGRQGDQCLHRYTQTLQMVRKGKWTEDEDAVRCHSRMALSVLRDEDLFRARLQNHFRRISFLKGRDEG